MSISNTPRFAGFYAFRPIDLNNGNKPLEDADLSRFSASKDFRRELDTFLAERMATSHFLITDGPGQRVLVVANDQYGDDAAMAEQTFALAAHRGEIMGNLEQMKRSITHPQLQDALRKIASGLEEVAESSDWPGTVRTRAGFWGYPHPAEQEPGTDMARQFREFLSRFISENPLTTVSMRMRKKESISGRTFKIEGTSVIP